jgi:hypothetical protein
MDANEIIFYRSEYEVFSRSNSITIIFYHLLFFQFDSKNNE